MCLQCRDWSKKIMLQLDQVLFMKQQRDIGLEKLLYLQDII